jgi:glutathione synthase
MAPTLISEYLPALQKFHSNEGDVIVKPLYGHGGCDVVRLGRGDPNLQTVVEMFIKLYHCPVVMQRYIPEIQTTGDKRIILLNGKPRGWLTRIPQEGAVRSNMVAGGITKVTALSERDHKICEQLGPKLVEAGLYFVGLDVIGDYVTEVNVTSPTGFTRINPLCSVRLEMEFWDMAEERYSVR